MSDRKEVSWVEPITGPVTALGQVTKLRPRVDELEKRLDAQAAIIWRLGERIERLEDRELAELNWRALEATIKIMRDNAHPDEKGNYTEILKAMKFLVEGSNGE